MSRFAILIGAASLLILGAHGVSVRADAGGKTLAITMTNDSVSNAVQVYDAATRALLQTLATQGQGGVGGNARGIRQYRGDLVAAVNNASSTVAIYRRQGDGLRFEKVVSTTSAPVSIDFGNGHMYVASATTIDSFVINGNTIGWRDGTATLQLATGGTPPNGSTAQIAALDDRRVLVTLKADPDPGTVDIIALEDGAVSDSLPTAVSAPAGTLTPFGFAVYPDGTAVITLAHSNQDGLFRNGAFTDVISAGQAAPCWMTRAGKYLFTANTGSKTISRLIATGNNIFVDAPVAASVTAGGGPSDIDAEGGVLGVIDRGAGQAHLSLFTYNTFGELAASGTPISLGTPAANGIAIVPPARAHVR
jgi:hypothetical protein